jgi:hypothetical protein
MPNKNEVSDFDISETHRYDDSVEILDFNENETVNNQTIVEKESISVARKNEQARELMINSAQLISEADSDIEATKSSVSENVNKFDDAKNKLLNSTIAQSQVLLEKVSYDYANIEQDEPFEISLGTVEEKVKVRDINSGGFSGFILALLSILAVVGGWIYVASEKLSIVLTPDIINNQEEQLAIFKWIGGITGAEVEPVYGMVTVGISALLVGWIVYKLRVSMRENKNLRVANETFEKSNIYAESQKEAKTEMERIDEHIIKTIPIIEDYTILIDEQNAKLQRVVHVEGIKEENSQYHNSSIDTMKETDLLMERIETLILTPITKDGKLNDASVYALNEAKSVSEYFVSKIYS